VEGVLIVPVVAAAAADRRVPKAPPGSKTAWHGRTNTPQNRTEKLPNVPSETLLERHERPHETY